MNTIIIGMDFYSFDEIDKNQGNINNVASTNLLSL